MELCGFLKNIFLKIYLQSEFLVCKLYELRVVQIIGYRFNG